MKKIVRLTEGQLYGLVEQVLNETDWKTYMNAARKTADLGDTERSERFLQAARGSFNSEYPDSKYEHFLEPDYGQSYYDGRGPHHYTYPTNRAHRRSGISGPVYKINGKGSQPIRIKDIKKPEIRDLAHYYTGNSEYEPGVGWKERDLSRKVAESIIRKLRRI